MLFILHDLLYDTRNHTQMYAHISKWVGLPKDAPDSDLALLYNKLYQEFRSWRDVSILNLASLLGLCMFVV